MQISTAREIHPNYRFLIEQAANWLPDGGKMLDFGCGKGDIVRLSLQRGIDAHGVEFFGPGSGTQIRSVLEERGLLNDRVLEYDGETLPFADETFDVVVSNQVFEHVPDLPGALSQIARVLKPGGKLICTFPYKGAFREGHTNTLFTHWIPKSRLRQYWLLGFRVLGIGRLKAGKGRMQWARKFNQWLDDNTFYLWWPAVEAAFGAHFSDMRGLEPAFLGFKLRDAGKTLSATVAESRLGRLPATLLVRKFGSLVLIATR